MAMEETIHAMKNDRLCLEMGWSTWIEAPNGLLSAVRPVRLLRGILTVTFYARYRFAIDTTSDEVVLLSTTAITY